MRQVGCYSVWVSPFLPICRWVGLCQIIFDNLPCLSTAQNICNMHRWSRYLLGTSVLLWCTEQLDRSECWDRSLGCPLLLLHSNPQASHCRTWAQCWCGISQQLHSQRGRCPCGSAGPCHEQRTWKKDGNYICLLHCNTGKNMLLMVSLLQWQEVVLAIFLTGWSGSKCPLNALRQKWLIKKLTLRFPSFFFQAYVEMVLNWWKVVVEIFLQKLRVSGFKYFLTKSPLLSIHQFRWLMPSGKLRRKLAWSFLPSFGMTAWSTNATAPVGCLWLLP